MTGGYSPAELEGRRRQADSVDPGPRDRFNPAAAQGVVDTFGVGIGSSGKFELNPLTLLSGFMPFGKALSVAKRLTQAGQMSKAAAILARSKIAERGRSVAGPIIADARYVDDLASDAFGARDFGAATGQARRYYQDALSIIRAGQRSRGNPVLGNYFPKVGPSLKVTMNSIRGAGPVSPVAKRVANAPRSFIKKPK
jgi:hypothetical protein